MVWASLMPLVANLANAPAAHAAGPSGNFISPGTIELLDGPFAPIPANQSDITGSGFGPYSGTHDLAVGRVGVCSITYTINKLTAVNGGGYSGQVVTQEKSSTPGACAGNPQAYNGPLNITDQGGFGPNGQAGATGGGTGGANGGGANGQNVECDSNGGFSWLICGVIHLLMGFVDWVRDSAITPFLNEPPLSGPPFDAQAKANGTDTIYGVWAAFRNIASVFFILIFMLVIIGTAVGFDNYTIKKVLPRLVAAAVLIPFSWYICAIMIDAGNIVGKGLVALFTGGNPPLIPKPTIDYTNSISVLFTTATFLAVAGLAAGAIWTFSAFTLISLGIILLVAFLTLVVRKILIIFLVVISPLAILAWILPNTQRFYRLWLENLGILIMMYPLVIMLFLIGRLFALVAPGAFGGGNAQAFIRDGVVPLVQILALYLPLAAIVIIPGRAKGLLGSMGKQIQRVGGAAEKRFGRNSDMANDYKERRIRRNLIAAKNYSADARLGVPGAAMKARIARARAGFGGGVFNLGKGGEEQRMRENAKFSEGAAALAKLRGQEQNSRQSPPESGDERVNALTQNEARSAALDRAGRRAVLDNLARNPAAGDVGLAYLAAQREQGRKLAEEHGKDQGTVQGHNDNPQSLATIARAAADLEREHQADKRGETEGILRGTANLNAADMKAINTARAAQGLPPATVEQIERARMRQRRASAADDKRESAILEEGAIRSKRSMEVSHHESTASLLSAATAEEREKIAQAKAMRNERITMGKTLGEGQTVPGESNEALVRAARLDARDTLAAQKAGRLERTGAEAERRETDQQILRAAQIKAKEDVTQAKGQRLEARHVVDEMNQKADATGDENYRFNTRNLLNAARTVSYNSESEKYGNRVGAINYSQKPVGKGEDYRASAADLARAASIKQQGLLGTVAGNARGTNEAADSAIAQYKIMNGNNDDRQANQELIRLAAQSSQDDMQRTLSAQIGQSRSGVRVNTEARKKQYEARLAEARATRGSLTPAEENDIIAESERDFDRGLIEHAEVQAIQERGAKEGTRLGEHKNMRENLEHTGTGMDRAVEEHLVSAGQKGEVGAQIATSGRRGAARSAKVNKPDLRKIAAGAEYQGGKEHAVEVRKGEGVGESAEVEEQELIDKQGISPEAAKQQIARQAGNAAAITAGKDTAKEVGTARGIVSGQEAAENTNMKVNGLDASNPTSRGTARANLLRNRSRAFDREVENEATGTASEERGIAHGRKENIEAMIEDATNHGTVVNGVAVKDMTKSDQEAWAVSEIYEKSDEADFLAGSNKATEGFGGALGSGRTIQAAIKARIAAAKEAKKKDPNVKIPTEREVRAQIARESHRNSRDSKATETGLAIGTVAGAVETADRARQLEAKTVQEPFPAPNDLRLDDGTEIKAGETVPVGAVLQNGSDLPPDQQVANLSEASDRMARHAVQAGKETGIRLRAQRVGETEALAEASARSTNIDTRLSAYRQKELDTQATQNADVQVQDQFKPGTREHETFEQALEGETRVKREAELAKQAKRYGTYQQVQGLEKVKMPWMEDASEYPETATGIPKDFLGRTPLSRLEPNLERNNPRVVLMTRAAIEAGYHPAVVSTLQKATQTTGAMAQTRLRVHYMPRRYGGVGGDYRNLIDPGQLNYAAYLDDWLTGTEGSKANDRRKPPQAVFAGEDEESMAKTSPGEIKFLASLFARGHNIHYDTGKPKDVWTPPPVMTERFKVIDQAVAAGKMTQEDADLRKDWLQSEGARMDWLGYERERARVAGNADESDEIKFFHERIDAEPAGSAQRKALEEELATYQQEAVLRLNDYQRHLGFKVQGEVGEQDVPEYDDALERKAFNDREENRKSHIQIQATTLQAWEQGTREMENTGVYALLRTTQGSAGDELYRGEFGKSIRERIREVAQRKLDTDWEGVERIIGKAAADEG
jgi:hypothetical protein